MLEKAKAWDKLNAYLSKQMKDGNYEIGIPELKSIMSEIWEKEYMKKASGEEVGNVLTVFVNTFTPDTEGFVKTVTGSHRTLQQSSFRLMVACMNQWAEFEGKGIYDARNEATVKASSQIVKTMKEYSIPFI